MYKFRVENQKEESLPELLGGLIGCLILLALYISVPVLFIVAAIKILLT